MLCVLTCRTRYAYCLLTCVYVRVEDVVAAGRLADAVHAHVVCVRGARGAVQGALLQQIVGARVGHTTEQLTAVLRLDWGGGEG